jgi:hypothetical protein
VLSNWNDTPELTRQLQQLRADVDIIQGDRPDGDRALLTLLPSFPHLQAEHLMLVLTPSIVERLGIEDVVYSSDAQAAAQSAFFITLPRSGDLTNAKTIEDLRIALMSVRWTVKVLSVPETVVPETFELERSFPRFQSGTIEVTRISTANEGDTAVTKVDVLVKYSDIIHQRITERLAPFPLAGHPSQESQQLELKWKTNQLPVSLPAAWFDRRFPHLLRHWGDIKGMTPDQAVLYADNLQTVPLNAQRIPLFGFELEGNSFGYAGATIVGGLLVYLIALLENLRGMNDGVSESSIEKATVAGVSAWVGFMTNFWARGIAWISLGFLPCGAVFLAAWRIVGLSPWTRAGISVAFLALGVRCVLLGQTIGKIQLRDSAG